MGSTISGSISKKTALTTAQTAVALSPAYQNGTEAEKEALGKTGEAEAARLAFNAENQTLTALQKEHSASLAAEAKLAASESAAKLAESPTSTVKTPEATNPSATDNATVEKYVATVGVVPLIPDKSYDSAEAARLAKSLPGTGGVQSSAAFSAIDPRRLNKPSSEPKKVSPAIPSMGSRDHRVRLRVPTSYLVGQAAGPNLELQKSDGIIFPYTPSISQDYKANYNSVVITHSNFNQYFYKSSAPGEISLTAKFTVQNEMEAGIYLSVIHLLRALTKMKTGNDQNAGSPPPICRLMAYGQYGLDNTPVAISSVGIEYLDNVDYFETGNSLVMYGANTVPVLATIKLTLIPIYSRNEQLKFSVGGWLTDNFRTKGYL